MKYSNIGNKEHMFMGTVVGIEAQVIPYAKKIIREFNPNMIIEFGTYHGGFTKYLAMWFPRIPLYTIDIVRMVSPKLEQYFRDKCGNVTMITTNQLFKNDFLIPTLVNAPVKKFLFCDNGYKIEEVCTYAGYLRPGDMLGIHDFGTEVLPDDVMHILKEFDEHPLNRELEKPGFSELRFFIKKYHQGRNKIPNDYLDNFLNNKAE